MEVVSVFGDSEEMPNVYTCDGENKNPRIEIINIPKNTKSLVLIMEDPDAVQETDKIWVHWLLWDIIPEIKVQETEEGPMLGVLAIEEGSNAGVSGRNSADKLGYIGPCPPKGKGKHRYYFRVYALNES
jgi:Raf kinase inhibitor-like YbhB/YbcL family protein